jgi:hypothetical protein
MINGALKDSTALHPLRFFHAASVIIVYWDRPPKSRVHPVLLALLLQLSLQMVWTYSMVNIIATKIQAGIALEGSDGFIISVPNAATARILPPKSHVFPVICA